MNYYEGTLQTPKGRFAIAVSRFNALVTEKLQAGALDALRRHGVAEDAVDVFRVPGVWELSGLVRALARRKSYAGIIALGCVIEGDTPHFDYVAGQVARGVGEATLSGDVAITFGVLTCTTAEQALDRAGLKSGNKGFDAAVACIEMTNLYAGLQHIS